MNLIESWRDSLSIFSPKHFSLLSLVTRKCLRSIFLHSSSLLVIVPLSIGIAYNMTYHDNHLMIRILSSVSLQILIVFLVLMVRASVKRKHCYYFLHYWPHMLFVGGFYSVLGVINYGLAFDVFDFYPMISTPVTVFWLLFFVDSHATWSSFIGSLGRGLLMSIYTLPLCLILSVVWYVLYVGSLYLSGIFISYLGIMPQALWKMIFGTIVGILLIPLWYCLLSNVYIKQLHEHFTQYFTVPSD